MSMSDPKMDWHGPAAYRISSSVTLHFAHLCEANFCTPRVSGALPGRVALSVSVRWL
jgi:hypothetical protein